MTDINSLVLEAFNSGASFYDSESDKTHRSADTSKIFKASQLTGISRGITSAMQKSSSGAGIGGVDKFLSRPSVDVPMLGKHSKFVEKKAKDKFNKIMGEKVI